jgi:hypothetical protein
VDDLDELLGGLGTWIVARCGWVDDVVADVVFNHFGDEAIEGTSACGDLLQNRGTIGLHLHRTFHRLELSADASDPGQKLLLSRLGV